MDATNRQRWVPGIVALEAGASYPLGSDRFTIDHGADYFAFFERMGELRYYLAVEGEEVLAVGCGILRREPRVWYLCDVKVRADARGRHIPLWMMDHGFLPNYLRCQRGYAVTMDPPTGENRVVRLAMRFRWLSVGVGPKLRIWSLTAADAARVSPVLERHRGVVRWNSLVGVKDLVLASTGRPMALLHAEFGPERGPERGPDRGPKRLPVDGAVHMFCAPDGDALTSELAAAGVLPSASASIIHHRMGAQDWRFVRTDEI